jgi:outer membrane protein OmpA-like peptidoglycan-associated protein
MYRTQILMVAAAAGLLAACSSTPERVEELEMARAVVPQVEASPRAGVAATNVSEARKALDRANKLADDGGKLDDIRFESEVAVKNAQIANEKILTAQAKEEIGKGTAERQAVLMEAREREARREAERSSMLEQELADMRARKTDRGMVVTLGDVLFDTGKSTLKPGAYRTIDRLAEVLKDSPSRKVTIEGHTDSVGSEELNQTLSERRADAVRNALVERGVRTEQIVAVGKGESTPVASNDDPGGRQRNRRVEMIFTEDGSRVASDAD